MAAVLEVFLLYSILYSSCLGIQPETRLEKVFYFVYYVSAGELKLCRVVQPF